MSLLDVLKEAKESDSILDLVTGKLIVREKFHFKYTRPFDMDIMTELLDLYIDGKLYPADFYQLLGLKNAEALRTSICRTYQKINGCRLPKELKIGVLYRDDKIRSSKETCLKTYGCEWASQSPEFRAKVAATCIERYGAVCFLATVEGRRKAMQTLMERYGVDNAFKSPEIKQRIREVLLERYGGIGFASPIINERIKQTCVERYGVENAGCLQSLTGIGDLDDNIAIWRYNERKRLEGDSEALRNFIMANFRDRGLYLHLRNYNFMDPRGPSNPEMIVASLLESLGLKFSTDNRPEFMRHPETNAKRELDFILDEYEIAIEVNGMFTHDSENGCDEDYHRFKFERCEENGLKLLMFTENEVVNNIQLVKDVILYHLGLQKKLNIPRECKVRFGFKSIFKSKKDELFQFGNFNHWYPV